MEFMVMKLQDIRRLTPIAAALDNEPAQVDLRQPARARNPLPVAQQITEYAVPIKDRPSSLFTTEQAACLAAQKYAEENPGVVYVVFRPLVVFEAKKPEKPEMIVKEFNQAGELVVMKE